MQQRMLSGLAILAAMAILAQGGRARAQDDSSSRPSPPAKASCKFADGHAVRVSYGSPRMRGRKIFGDLVPYNEVWRAGADEATTFVSDSNLLVGGKPVSRGSYTIYALPMPEAWKLIISRRTGEWGIPYPGERYDLMRAEMQVSPLPAVRENFTIAFDAASHACTVRLEWEKTRASIQVEEAPAK